MEVESNFLTLGTGQCKGDAGPRAKRIFLPCGRAGENSLRKERRVSISDYISWLEALIARGLNVHS